MRLVRQPDRYVIRALRFMLLSVPDVIVSYRLICALLLLLLLLRRMSRSEKPGSSHVRPLPQKLGPLPLFVASSGSSLRLCKPLSLLINRQWGDSAKGLPAQK